MTAWARASPRRAFALTAFVAATFSAVAFAGALSAGATPHGATLLRLVVSAPLLFLGMAWLRDPLRVGFAVGASTGAKLALEPLLTAMLLDHDAVLAVPLVGDLGYGAIILATMLRNVQPQRFALA